MIKIQNSKHWDAGIETCPHTAAVGPDGGIIKAVVDDDIGVGWQGGACADACYQIFLHELTILRRIET